MTTAEAKATTVTGMDAVYYMTQDFKRARSFYENILGLKPGPEISGGGGGSFVEYELHDGTTFGLGHMPGMPWHESGGVMFSVGDVKAALDRVKAAGVPIDFDYMEREVCDMAWARDTEGNTFCLHRRKTT